MINTILLVGNICGEGKFFEFENSVMYTNSLCFKKKIRGEYQPRYINIKCFGHLAKHLNKHLSKGAKVTVNGPIDIETNIKDGVKYVNPVIELDNIDIHTKFIGGKEQMVDDLSISQDELNEIANMVIPGSSNVNAVESKSEESTSEDNSGMTLVDEKIPFDDNMPNPTNSSSSTSDKQEEEKEEVITDVAITSNAFFGCLDEL